MKQFLVTLSILLLACSSGATLDRDTLDGDGTGGSGHLAGDSLDEVGNLGDAKGFGDSVVPPKPGEFGAPCTSNEDCLSGYCIEGLDGYICTKLCMEDCPAGYDCVGVNIGPDVVFICVPLLDRSCEPCTSDLQCSGGRCVPFGGSKYCLSPCAATGCKASYDCQNVQIGDDLQELCMPDSGTCECVAASIGLEKACKQKTGTNVCYGVQFCEADGWGDCGLPDEFCDGKDNDCNGIIDDGMLNPNTGKYDSDAHCGVCNNSCVAMAGEKAFGKCNASGALPTCVWDCEEGYFDVNNNPNDGCECEYLSAEDDPDVAGDANCDDLDGVAAKGVFVAKNGAADNPGTREAPLLTVQQGIDKAKAGSRPYVFVATGVYVESIHLKAGLGIYGGYSADFRYRDGAINQTVIMGLPFTMSAPGAVNAVAITGTDTVFSGFHVFGGDAVEAGGSSYAVYVRDCDSSLRIVNNWVVGGNGRDGIHGDDGDDGSDGTSGQPGEGAYDIMHSTCIAGDWTSGGSGGQQTCGGTAVHGGNGGSGICPDFDETGTQPKSIPYNQTQTDDEWGQNGQGAMGGIGGEPGFDALLSNQYSACGVCNVPKDPAGEYFIPSLGADGEHGPMGDNGFGAGGCTKGGGEVANGLWVGLGGASGGSGAHGNGGGGGGAGGGVETKGCDNVSLVKFTDIGGSGGGGGSGGCAGNGGEGGSHGGGSFGIFVLGQDDLTSLPFLLGNVIQTGFGGDGGDGGAGGVGGEGGSGESGGLSGESKVSAWCADAGGHGGNGGRGGHGGGGGGGCGGPSFAIYLAGPETTQATTYLSENAFLLDGLPGQGGAGGKSMGNAGNAGLTGASAEANF